MLSDDVEAWFGLPNPSIATPAGILAITVPLAVMPETNTLKNVLSPLSRTVAVVAPAVPPRVTSPVSKPVTGSLNTTVKTIGEASVGSGCSSPWSIVTDGPAPGPASAETRRLEQSASSPRKKAMKMIDTRRAVFGGCDTGMASPDGWRQLPLIHSDKAGCINESAPSSHERLSIDGPQLWFQKFGC